MHCVNFRQSLINDYVQTNMFRSKYTIWINLLSMRPNKPDCYLLLMPILTHLPKLDITYTSIQFHAFQNSACEAYDFDTAINAKEYRKAAWITNFPYDESLKNPARQIL